MKRYFVGFVVGVLAAAAVSALADHIQTGRRFDSVYGRLESLEHRVTAIEKSAAR